MTKRRIRNPKISVIFNTTGWVRNTTATKSPPPPHSTPILDPTLELGNIIARLCAGGPGGGTAAAAAHPVGPGMQETVLVASWPPRDSLRTGA